MIAWKKHAKVIRKQRIRFKQELWKMTRLYEMQVKSTEEGRRRNKELENRINGDPSLKRTPPPR